METTKVAQVQPAARSSSSPIVMSNLPLTHFDIPFLTSAPTQRLLFFQFPCPNNPSLSLQTILPSLTRSLSSALSLFLPLAGNIVVPLHSSSSSSAAACSRPFLRYIAGDSVSLTVSQSHQDFHYLTGNNNKCYRAAVELRSYIPPLPPATRVRDSFILPVMAVQVTIFPRQGICIGLNNHHAAADECSIANFLKVWGSIHKFKTCNNLDVTSSLPVFDRTQVDRPGSASSLLSRALNFFLQKSTAPFPVFDSRSQPSIPTSNKVRATFVLTKTQVEKLKLHISSRLPKSSYVSSFSTICAFIWSCSEKSSEDDVDDDEPVYFPFAADCRGRLNPPLPQTYFGNCVVFVVAKSRHGLIKGEQGFLNAAKAIGEAIRGTLHGEDDDVVESAKWPLDFGEFEGKRGMSVAGSPRFDVYNEVDYGWGKPKKYEFVHIDEEGSMSLCKSREFEGGFEVGVARKKSEMVVFEHVFALGLDDESCA